MRVHVGDGRHADARRLDDVDGVDAHAWTVVGCRRGDVPRHVGREPAGERVARITGVVIIAIGLMLIART